MGGRPAKGGYTQAEEQSRELSKVGVPGHRLQSGSHGTIPAATRGAMFSLDTGERLKRWDRSWRLKRHMQMRRMHTMIAVAVVAAVTSGTVATAQDPLPDVDQFGPQVGETVPDFSLVDQFGETRTLQSLMGPNGLMLVFSRSADW